MSVKLNKKHMLCAGATGLWFLVAKASTLSHTSTESGPAERNALDAPEDQTLEELDMIQRTLSFSWADEKCPLDAAAPGDLSPAASTSSGISTGSPLTLTLSSSNALEQLKKIMPCYNERVIYEDNILSIAGNRCLFYHFLSLIWVFLQIEISVKNLDRQEIEPKKVLYTADCTRNFVFRSIPLVHYFLPEAINCEVKTICQVEGDRIVHHKDVYNKFSLSWKLKIPTLWSITKYTAGMAYTYLLNMFYFLYHLLHIVISMLGFEKE